MTPSCFEPHLAPKAPLDAAQPSTCETDAMTQSLAFLVQGGGKTIVFAANSSWNLVHFRGNLIAALRQRNFRVLAIAPQDSYSGRLAEQVDQYLPLNFRSASASPLHDAKLFLRYASLLRRIRPALFLGFTIKPNIYGSLAARFLRIPVINNVSGLGTAFITRGLITRITTVLYKLAFQRSSTVFFQNDEDYRQFTGEGILKPKQGGVLPGSGVDLERFTPAPLPAEEPFTFLLIARLVWDKGVQEYVNASSLVRQRYPNARFQILGPVDVDNRTAVPRTTLDRWVAQGIVEHLGAADDIRSFVASAHCVVLPSYREGLPRSLLEASAMARPIIGADVPGVRDVVSHGISGVLCEPRSGDSLAAAMLLLMARSREERIEMGLAGRRRVEREFGIKVVTHRYLEAVNAAL